MQTQDSTADRRSLKALRLLDEGKVHLVIGQKHGLVDGSNGEQYRVSRDACECADWVNRQPEGGCCHQRALRAVCREYKQLRALAKAGETVRPSVALLKALGWLATEAPASPSRVPAGALVDGKGVPYCHDCGETLVRGRCPRQGSRLRELGYQPEVA